MLTISVKNFGPIAEGSVDLKPLTIFVGPSNTGKSYMATAVYAVMRAVEGRYKVPITLQIGARPGADYAEDVPFCEFPDEIKETVNQDLQKVVGDVEGIILRQLGLVSGGQFQFVRRTTDPFDFRLRIERKQPSLTMVIALGEDSVIRDRSDISSLSASTGLLHLLSLDESGNDSDVWREHNIGAIRFNKQAALYNLLDDALELTFLEFPPTSFYLPASRSGIVQAHKVLSAALVRQSSQIGIREWNVPAMPAIAAEFLSYLIGLSQQLLPLESKKALDLATHFIETQVLKGKIDLDKSNALPYPEIAYEIGEERFTIDQTSAMVSDLAPLILFLKYLIHEGDLLILEEPESHLHPAAQRQLARGIVRLVNAGVKVLITTHSDIFVSQINNLLRASYASKRWLREHGYAPEDCIQHEDVSAYLFRMDDEGGGSRTERLEIQRDIGIDDPMFNQVIHELYEESLLVERIRPK